MNARVKRWGNSLALRIPRRVASEIGLEENSEVELSVQRGRLVVRCVRRFRYDLATLLAKVTPQNQHPEMDWGSPVGKETW